MRCSMWAALCVVGGCQFGGKNKATGEIRGTEVSITDGFMVQGSGFDPATGDGLVVVVLTDLHDACSTLSDLDGELEGASTAAARAQVWEASVPDDFWEITLTLRVSDPGDDLSKHAFDGVGWDELLEAPEQVYGVLTHYQQTLDEAYWNGLVDPAQYVESWFTDGGDLPVKKHRPSEFIRGRFVTEAVEISGGDRAGDIELKFDVDRCQGAERFYFD